MLVSMTFTRTGIGIIYVSVVIVTNIMKIKFLD